MRVVSDELEITAWAEADRDGVIDLILAIQQREFEPSITLDDQPDLVDPTTFYGASGGRFWVARRNGRLVGTIAALVVDENTAVVWKMFVHETARGGDVAGGLMDTLVEWARATGYRTLLLGTTAVMRSAHRFYENTASSRSPPIRCRRCSRAWRSTRCSSAATSPAWSARAPATSALTQSRRRALR